MTLPNALKGLPHMNGARRQAPPQVQVDPLDFFSRMTGLGLIALNNMMPETVPCFCGQPGCAGFRVQINGTMHLTPGGAQMLDRRDFDRRSARAQAPVPVDTAPEPVREETADERKARETSAADAAEKLAEAETLGHVDGMPGDGEP